MATKPLIMAVVAALILVVPGSAGPIQESPTEWDPYNDIVIHQWNLQHIYVEDAWDITAGSEPIAILDTGVDDSHPDLEGRMCGPQKSFVPGAPSGDRNGHGTHVAGIAGATRDNREGIAGISKSCLQSVQVLDSNGTGTTSQVAEGIEWAADQGFKIINLSLSFCVDDPVLKDAVAYAYGKGALLVAAAGNNVTNPAEGDLVDEECNLTGIHYPAAYSEVMAVGAHRSGTPAPYQATGPEMELLAPGTYIISTWTTSGQCPTRDLAFNAATMVPPFWGDYCSLNGTSMASPHVAATAALMWTANPNLTRDEVRCILHQPSNGHRGSTHGFGNLWAGFTVRLADDDWQCS